MIEKNIKIFLDDVRIPANCLSYMHTKIGTLNPIYLEEWIIVKNYDEFIKTIQKNYGKISHISFDHDLADEHYTPEFYWNDYNASKDYQEKQNYKEKTGYDCALWLKNTYKKLKYDLPQIIVHSMNPVGADNIKNVFK